MFANCSLGGQSFGFPDVCLTPAPPAPPIPTPYPNISTTPMGVPPVPTILFNCGPAHNMGTVVPMTNGDNAGLATGVASGMVMGPARPITAAFTVLLSGQPCVRMTSQSLHNSTNVPGTQIAPSQTKVLVLAP
jgi:hypothetical protein